VVLGTFSHPTDSSATIVVTLPYIPASTRFRVVLVGVQIFRTFVRSQDPGARGPASLQTAISPHERCGRRDKPGCLGSQLYLPSFIHSLSLVHPPPSSVLPPPLLPTLPYRPFFSSFPLPFILNFCHSLSLLPSQPSFFPHPVSIPITPRFSLSRPYFSLDTIFSFLC